MIRAIQSKDRKESHTNANLHDDSLVHAWKNEAQPDLLHAMLETVQGS
jgi:hypothetical protein